MGNAGKKNKPRFPRSKYTVGWICALDLEMSASMAMFDERHGQAEDLDPGDTNTYQFGQIGPHKIVIACLGTYGTSSATEVATNMVRSFRSLTIRLMVGIAGGVPSKVHDIRLGDVVVSRPGKDAAVIQYDFGKSTDSGNFVPTGLLSNPPPKLLSALSAIRADHMLDGGSISIFTEHLKDLPAYFQHPGAKAADRLYAFNYKHVAGDSNCDECDQKQEVKRPPRDSTLPFVHYGAVGSGNQVMKDGVKRDELRDKHGILCFEMEAAGLMNSFPCLVIRGICDYSDSHKHKEWQPYAAATAAAYAKCLLGMIP
ncbi:nucleoside phosphorylase domain-containing protein, partial [Cladorrhinum samala]